MKRLNIIVLGCCLGLSSCYDLDLNPLSNASNENWYSNETEIEMSIKDFYRPDFWYMDSYENTDDHMYRETISEIVKGSLNGQSGIVTTLWANQYKAIARANTLISNLKKASEIGVPETKIKQYEAEALFQRATCYARLVTYFGDVVYLTEVIDIDEAFTKRRTSKAEVIKNIYADYDKAADVLPEKYTGSSSQRATRGAALALKARFALYMGDWAIARDAAKQCIDLNIYKLHPSYTELFLSTTKNSSESIFLLPRSIEFKSTLGNWTVMNEICRNAGGWGAFSPTWDLLAAYTCTDGLPIDESPLFDPHNPFKNRDPRCTATIIEFGTPHLGFIYDPHPDAVQVKNLSTGKMQKNNDARVNAQFASFNGLLWKKGIDETWLENGKDTDPDNIIIRYADVLLIYAEAMIELKEIDQSTLDAINMVRARAYGVEKTETGKYPEVITTDQQKLRTILRTERRVEFAKEGLRYMDLVRWKLASDALTRPNYGMLYPINLLREKVIDKGLWFWPATPQIDENGLADFSGMEKAGLIAPITQRLWNDRQYLWPLPTKELLINKNLEPNNPGY